MDAGIGIVGYSPSKAPVQTETQSYTQTIVSSSGNFKPNWTNSKPGSARPLGKTYNKPFQDVIKTKGTLPNQRKFTGSAQNSSRSNTPSRPNSARSKTLWQNNHNDSYVDETLFGPQGSSAGFKAPWDGPDPVIHNFDLTNYKQKQHNEGTPRQKRPISARSKGKYRTNHAAGDIDETLFGPGGSGMAPFEHSIQGSAVTIYSGEPTSSRPGSARPSSRPGSARPSSRQQSRPGSAQKIKHSESFVDETLFGPKPVEPDFAAPWDKPEKKSRPMFCDSSNYAVIIQHPPNTNRPKPTVKLRNTPAILPDKKPVWK